MRVPRGLIASTAALSIVLPVGWMWQQSLVPSTYSMMDMGTVELGGAEPPAHALGHSHHGEVSVVDLVADPDQPADVTEDLVVSQGTTTLASGREVTGFTVNGTTPGPALDAVVGDLLEITVRNDNVADGVALHWHGLDVPNAADGVAGVTQDAIAPGESHVYRFVVDRPGTYWYHSHQVSHPQVVGGLFGSLTVQPKEGIAQDLDKVAVAHTYAGRRTLNGGDEITRVEARPGQTVRLRVVNTDDGALRTWADAPVRLLAVDGTDLNAPEPFTDQSVSVPAGGRVDLEVTTPSDGSAVQVQVGQATAVVVGPATAEEPGAPEQPDAVLDLLTYGAPAALPFDADDPDRTFDYRIGRRPGFVDGKPGVWWTVNGKLYPDVPMFMVAEGDLVRFHVENKSSEVHPMHLHGHRALVLARDGEPSTGSPVWVDSFDVDTDETVDVAFRADNPGIWMDHCHNLDHADEGLVAHLMYEGVTTPYEVGGEAGNDPE